MELNCVLYSMYFIFYLYSLILFNDLFIKKIDKIIWEILNYKKILQFLS